QDPSAKVACETLVTRNLVVIAGETFSKAVVDVEETARRAIREIGYTDGSSGFSDSSPVDVRIHAQASEIRQGVERSAGELGAGDQGLMFGYACNETPELMPLPIMLAHNLMRRQAQLRRDGRHMWLLPDGKSQVTVRYRGHRPVAVENVVLSTQHTRDIGGEPLREAVIEEIIKPVVPGAIRSDTIRYFVNPTGSFNEGGPATDTGLTGRKIIVDTYGGSCSHGGGAFSGKDPTKVDRSGAYAARHIAKNIVAAGLAERCIVQVSFAIGVSNPTSLWINLCGTGSVDERALESAIPQGFPVTPKGIIDSLNLRRPIYGKTAAYGHFGRNEPEFEWEKTEHSGELLRSGALAPA
ncbi:MAG TPA: methionine adenosyltransferase, partial [Bacteroidota bacterium]|nr:methionine adenosyltransferase [Bacteroidota bacterium]